MHRKLGLFLSVPVAGLFGREIPRKCTSKTNGRTYQHGNVRTCIESSGCSCRSAWTTSKWLGRADPRTHVENSAKEIDVEEPTPLIDPEYLGCTQREKQRWITEQFEPKLSCSEHGQLLVDLNENVLQTEAIRQDTSLLELRHKRPRRNMC